MGKISSAIIEAFMAQGEMNAGDIHALGTLTPQGMSRHIKVLHQHEVMSLRREKQMRKYRLNPEKFNEINDWLEQARVFWTSGFDAMEALINKQK